MPSSYLLNCCQCRAFTSDLEILGSQKNTMFLKERQVFPLERFSVLHENKLIFCIIVLDKIGDGW